MRKEAFVIKKTIMLSLTFMLSFNLLVGCGKEGKKERETDVTQIESTSLDVELETESKEHEFETEVESETESIESNDVELETEIETEINTEATTSNKAETDKQTTNQNSTGKNNSSQSSSSNKNTNNTEGKEVGLGKDSYEYITGGLSNQASKEVELGKEIIKKIIKNGMSDYEKVKAINDYMMLNVSYDSENLKNNTIPAVSYTALGAMEKKVAVCAGYAKMFQVLANCAGLEATYVTGDTPYGYHAWNQVKVEGKWYNIDVTWNDPDCETNKEGHYYCGCYQYFLLSNEDFNKKHEPFAKVNETGSSRDFEAYKQGCPYDEAMQYCKTQADFDMLVKEMVAANKTTIRVMTDDSKKEDMILNALKNQGIYGDCKVTIKNGIRVYRETNEKISKITIDIALSSGSYAEAKRQKIASVDDAKKVLENAFGNFETLKLGDSATVKLYVGADYLNNYNLQAELYRWAEYEKKMNIFIYNDVKEVETGVYELKVSFNLNIDDVAFEMITDVNDIEAAIKRMFQYGYSKISVKIYPNGYKLSGSENEAKKAFVEKYCRSLIEKYCLSTETVRVDFDENTVSIKFVAEGHDLSGMNWEISKEATCVSDGLEVRICRICNQLGETRVIPKNESHSCYWDTNEDENIRIQKCKLCSHVGLTEYRYGGIWGYFDDEAAQQKLFEINLQRANIRISKHDEWGNILPAYSPPQLMVDNELEAKAKERLVELNASDFDSCIAHEYAIRRTPYSNTYKNKIASSYDMYHERYDEIGIICFKFDYNDDGTNFGIIYVMEFGLSDEYEALEQ